MKNVLHLNVHRRFFDEIAAGTKTEEYRERTDYWASRLEDREYDYIVFRNGYGPAVPEMHVEWRGVRKTTRKGDQVYAIRLGRILKVSR